MINDLKLSPLRSDNNCGKDIFVFGEMERLRALRFPYLHKRGLFGKAVGSFLSKFRRSGAPVRSTGAEQGGSDSFAKESSQLPANQSRLICSPSSSARISAPVAGRLRTR